MKMKWHGAGLNTQSGFTVVELLIATTVFSAVLLLMTVGIIQVTNTFFKGTNDANVQRVSSSVLGTISQAIQFDGGAVTQTTSPAGDTLCVGNTQQFSYWPGFQLEPTANIAKHQRKAAFVENTGRCTGTPSPTGRELLTDNMRVSDLSLTCLSNCSSPTSEGVLWRIELRLVYGDDNLLTPSPTATNATCKGAESGEQFCAVSDTTTAVSERV
jgi:hypothetical protein